MKRIDIFTIITLILLSLISAILANPLPITDTDITAAANTTEDSLFPEGYYLSCKDDATTKACAAFPWNYQCLDNGAPKRRLPGNPCEKACRCLPKCPLKTTMLNFAKICISKRDGIDEDMEAADLADY